MAEVSQATTASPEDQGRKVFVGNLTFETTEENLQEIFAGHGALTDAQIINRKYSRGNRSLGYGFVTFATEQEAAAAISALDKSEHNGRVINVELAKPPTPKSAVAKEAPEAAGGEAASADAAGNSPARGGRRGRGRARSRGRGRGRGRRGADIPADGEADVASAAAGVESLNLADAATTEGAEKAGEDGANRGARRGRGRGGIRRVGPPQGEPSKTLLFVANLPFSLDNDGLKALFEGYNVVNAHVVPRKYGPVSGRSKGFGFVEAADEAEQQKILENFNGKQVDGREIQIKVAIDPPAPAEGAEQAETEAAPALEAAAEPAPEA